MRLLAIALLSFAAVPVTKATGSTSAEVEAIATYEDACLASPIHQRATAEWARLNADPAVDPSEYRSLVYGKLKNVWRTNKTASRIYVSLDEQLACKVWFQSNNASGAVEGFRKIIQREREFSSADSTIEQFRDGEAAPGLYVLSYLIRFKSMDVGLMWTVYVSTNEVPAAISYGAARVRVENLP